MLVGLEVIKRLELAGDNVFVTAEGGGGRGGGRGGELLVEGVQACGDFPMVVLDGRKGGKERRVNRWVWQGRRK